MSNEKVLEARLPGFNGPYFDGLEAIQNLFGGDLQRIHEVFLSDTRKAIRTGGPKVLRLVMTDDGYPWKFCIRFTHYGREVRVLIPGMLDSNVTDGTYADRHVALYYQGDGVTAGELARIIRKVTVAFEETYEKHYGHIV